MPAEQNVQCIGKSMCRQGTRSPFSVQFPKILRRFRQKNLQIIGRRVFHESAISKNIVFWGYLARLVYIVFHESYFLGLLSKIAIAAPRLEYSILELFYSAIHKAAVWPATIQNNLRRLFLLVAPIDSQWTLLCSTGIIPGKPLERPWIVKPLALWIVLLIDWFSWVKFVWTKKEPNLAN